MNLSLWISKLLDNVFLNQLAEKLLGSPGRSAGSQTAVRKHVQLAKELPGRGAVWLGTPCGRVEASPGMLRPCLHQAIGGQASRSLMDCFADILFALNKHCFSLLSMWIKEALQPPGFPSARLSPEQKDTFSQQILR